MDIGVEKSPYILEPFENPVPGPIELPREQPRREAAPERKADPVEVPA